MKHFTWAETNSFWIFDGSLTDRYILESNLKDWQTFLDWAADNFFCRYGFAHEEMKLPEIEKISLPIVPNCHFFSPEEIETDIDTIDIKGESQQQELFEFIEMLSDKLSETALLVPENYKERAFFKYTPKRDNYREKQ